MSIVDFLVLLFSCVAEIIICDVFVAAFQQRRSIPWWGRKLILLGSIIIIFSINLLGVANLNLVFVPIAIYVFIFFSFDTGIIQALMYSIIVVFAFLGGEFIFIFFSGFVQQDSAVNLGDVPGVTFIATLISYIILVAVKQIAPKSRVKMANKIFALYLCVPVASLAMMLMTYFIVEEYLTNDLIKTGITICYGLMLFCNIIIFFAFNGYAKEIQKGIEQEWIIDKEKINKEYYTKVAEVNEEQKSIMHDIKHYMRLISSADVINRSEFIEELSNKLNLEIEESEKKLISDAPILDVLLSEKRGIAENNQIDFNVTVEPGLRFGETGEADYIIMLSNILDNAIEAAAKSEDNRTVKINIFRSVNDGFIVCRVENSYKQGELQIIDGEFISTKNESGIHGYGIKNIVRSAEKNGGSFNINVEDKKVITTLILPI